MRRRVHRRRPARLVAALATTVALLFGAMSALQPAAMAADNPYQRGPDPTVASVAANHGPFATAQLSVAPGNGFNGG